MRTKIKFHLAPVLIGLFAGGLLYGLYVLRVAPTVVLHVHRKLPTYGFYNMRTLEFTMQYAWDAQLQAAKSNVTVQVSCSRVLWDTAVCHGVPSNGGQSEDVAVQVTKGGNDFKLSQYR